MNPIVFAGPSLHGAELGSLEAIDLAPPAACGDILRAVEQGRTSIGLIDGTFEAAPAVWHKEILYALAAGCRVLGAASMGALRAAECEAFGMIGVGEIFADYRDGRRQSDGDVALTHGPAELGHIPLSLALVDAEDALLRLRSAGLLAADQYEAAVAAARALFFKHRTWERIFADAGIDGGMAEGLTAWLVAAGPSLKTRDALLLLEEIGRPQPAGQKSRFISTRLFDQLRLRLDGMLGAVLLCLTLALGMVLPATVHPTAIAGSDGAAVSGAPASETPGSLAGLPALFGVLKVARVRSADRATARVEEADEYRQRCRDNGVPVPPPISDGGGWSDATDLSRESAKYLVFTPSAKAWTYRAEDGGYCVAMLRETDNGRAALGTICSDAAQRFACFFDSLTYQGGKVVALSGEPAIEADFNSLVRPLDYTESCDSCHLGNNPFIVDPNSVLGRVVASVYRLPDVHDTKSLHFQFVDVGNHRWINPPPLPIAPGSPAAACTQCHDFPSVRASGYCDAVLQVAPGRFMPPQWAASGRSHVRLWPDPSTGCTAGPVPAELQPYLASVHRLAKLCMPQMPDCRT